MMKLYQKLQENDLVENHKDFIELIRLRAIKINKVIIDDPNHELKENDKVQIGILSID